MKPFEKWKYEALEETFGISRVKQLPLLEHWLSSPQEISVEERAKLIELRSELADEIENWQEDELKSWFIMPLLHLINFRKPGVYKTFTQRNIEAFVTALDNTKIELKGRVEAIVASGKQDPKAPFLFVHEYKPHASAGNDPLGQLLAAMLVAKAKNPKGMDELYGLYIIGRHWYFVVLSGNIYAVSRDYSATGDDLFQIASILKTRKKAIESFLSSTIR